jgi:outer membrane protein assembly factor BamD (BamD/ComL family)
MIILIAASLCAGCASTAKKGESAGFVQRYSESKRLTKAVDMLAKGDSSGAAKEFNAISLGTPIPGVTDEALFRLALLSLKPGTERQANGQAYQLLKRLKKEHPASPWTAQATPLIDLLNAADELKRQHRNLKDANQSLSREIKELNNANQSLSREIKELNRNIEKLKDLDLELERKAR